MTIEPTYRTVDVLTDLPPEQRRGAIFSGDLVLVPDTRLQAIADAWKAINDLDKNHIYNAGAGKLVVAIEDAFTEEKR